MAYSYSAGPYGAGLYSAEDTPENTAISSWSFGIDGHSFVFLKLGTQGTFVYDLSTGQWSTWTQGDFVGLGFNDGQWFDELNLMGSLEDGTIYSFDPDALDDYSGAFSAVVTGGIPARGRDSIECFAVYLAGERSDKVDREISLLTSDDNGNSWSLNGVRVPQSVNEDIDWRSLGIIRSPGRLFAVVDNGALKSIDGLKMGASNGS